MSLVTPIFRTYPAALIGMRACLSLIFSLFMLAGPSTAQETEAKTDADAKTEAEPEAAAEEKPLPGGIEDLGDGNYKLGNVRFNKESREIRLNGEVCQNEVVLEFAIVNVTNGKVHEALLTTSASPLQLNVVMKLLRYQQSERDIWPTYDEDGKEVREMKVDDKGGMNILVELEKDGKKKQFPISDWITNESAKKVMPADAWVYTGSQIVRGYFIAETDGSIVAIYRDTNSLINQFLDGSDNDDIWFPRKGHVPVIGTEVEIVIQPKTKPSA